MTTNISYNDKQIKNIVVNFERIITAKETDYQAAEIYTDFIRMFKLLPVKQKQAIYYRYCLGHTNKETAGILNIRPSGVTNLVNRAIDNIILMVKGEYKR